MYYCADPEGNPDWLTIGKNKEDVDLDMQWRWFSHYRGPLLFI
jgi:hypothetical protein